MKKEIGIWIDKRTARITSISGNNKTFHIIESDVEEFHVKGGSGSRLKGGPQDVVQDSKYLEREKHLYKKYFSKIVDYIKNADSLVIFGPAQTGEKLRNEISKSYPQIKGKVKGLEKTDSMTDNEIKSWVKKYFT